MIHYFDYMCLNEEELVHYVESHNNDFPIPISKKVNIEEYIKKIIKIGNMILAFDNDLLVGIIFYYDNDENSKNAFISLLSVDSKYRNRGIASFLVKEVISHVDQRMNFCLVPTHESNIKAISLYNALGFRFKESIDDKGNILLIKKL